MLYIFISSQQQSEAEYYKLDAHILLKQEQEQEQEQQQQQVTSNNTQLVTKKGRSLFQYGYFYVMLCMCEVGR